MELIYVVCCSSGEGWGDGKDHMIRAFKTEEACEAYCEELQTIHDRNKKRMDELNAKLRAGQMTKDDWDEHGALCNHFTFEAGYTANYYIISLEFEE